MVAGGTKETQGEEQSRDACGRVLRGKALLATFVCQTSTIPKPHQPGRLVGQVRSSVGESSESAGGGEKDGWRGERQGMGDDERKEGQLGAVRVQRPSLRPVQIKTSHSETQREFYEGEVRSGGRRTKRDEATRFPV